MHVGDHQPIQPLARTGPPAAHVAASIVEGFNRHYALFRYGAQRAKSLFESGDWRGIQQLSRERIEYYDMRVRECSSALATALRGDRFGMEADRVAVSDSSAGHGLPDLVELTDEQKAIGVMSEQRTYVCWQTINSPNAQRRFSTRSLVACCIATTSTTHSSLSVQRYRSTISTVNVRRIAPTIPVAKACGSRSSK